MTLANFIDQDTHAMLVIIVGQFAARVAHVGTFVVPAWISVRVGAYLERETGAVSFRRELAVAVFIAYLVVLAAATIVPLQQRAASGPGIVSFIPGRTTMRCYRTMTGTPVELVICNLQLLGNILLFAPLGLLLPLVWDRVRSVRAIVLSAAAASVTIEIIQYFQRFMGMNRSVDIDDVILNVIGAVVGYLSIRYAVQHRTSSRASNQ